MLTNKARIDENNWMRCGKCSHKLMKVIGGGSFPKIEIKCHSCKTINVWEVQDIAQKRLDSRFEGD